MSKKFKVGCKYQVKPEFYDSFWFSSEDWRGKEKDHIFTVNSINNYGDAVDDYGNVMACISERKYCKRIEV